MLHSLSGVRKGELLSDTFWILKGLKQKEMTPHRNYFSTLLQNTPLQRSMKTVEMKLNRALRLFYVDGVNLFDDNVNTGKGNTDAPQAPEGRWV
jgi:hypothetical protein